ncbi:hypothetical protein ABK040_002656 [Willaertia magna]
MVNNKVNDANQEYNLIACVRCRERHKKCDRKLPSCSYCSNHQVECIYQAPKKVRKFQKRELTNNNADQSISVLSSTLHGNPSVTNQNGTDNKNDNTSQSTQRFEIFTFKWNSNNGTNNQQQGGKKKRKSSIASERYAPYPTPSVPSYSSAPQHNTATSVVLPSSNNIITSNQPSTAAINNCQFVISPPTPNGKYSSNQNGVSASSSYSLHSTPPPIQSPVSNIAQAILIANTFKQTTYDFYYQYVAVGYVFLDKEIIDEVLFTPVTNNIKDCYTRNEVLALLYAIHASVCQLLKYNKDEDLAIQRSEELLPSETVISNDKNLLIFAAGRNLILGLIYAGRCEIDKVKSYVDKSDELLGRFIPNYASLEYIDYQNSLLVESISGEFIGNTCVKSVQYGVSKQEMSLLKFRAALGMGYDNLRFLTEYGVQYLEPLYESNYVNRKYTPVYTKTSLNLRDDLKYGTFDLYVGKYLMNMYFYTTGLIPHEILIITQQVLTPENLQLFLTMLLLAQKELQSYTDSRVTFYKLNPTILQSPISSFQSHFVNMVNALSLYEAIINSNSIVQPQLFAEYADKHTQSVRHLTVNSLQYYHADFGCLVSAIVHMRMLEIDTNNSHHHLNNLKTCYWALKVIRDKFPKILASFDFLFFRMESIIKRFETQQLY